MRILFLTSRIDSPSFRFRVQQYLPYLEMDYTINEIPRNWFKRKQWLRSLGDFDVIFIQRRLLMASELKRLKKKARRLYYDFDDALMYRDSQHGAAISKKRFRRFVHTVRSADLVIAGNDFLFNEAKRFSDRVTILPTIIDTDRYIPISKDDKDEVIIGWIGSKSTLLYLKDIVEILSRMYRLKIICDDFSGFQHVSGIIMKRWDINTEVEDLQSFDIGIMPLTDDNWTRGKCGFKIIQYMAVGVPVVCSPVGVNRKIVTHGVNGFFAKEDREWKEYIGLLISDKGLRNRMGKAGRELVVRDYSLKRWAPYMAKLLKEGL